MTAVSAEKRMSELKLQTAQLTQSHQEELTSIYTAMLAEQHDLKHRINAAEQLLKSESSDDIRSQVAELLKDTKVLNENVTGNAAVDAILAAKQTIMKQSQMLKMTRRHQLIEFKLRINQGRSTC